MNISSAIVIPSPDHIEAVTAGLGQLPGVEIAVVSPEGKIIVTIESQGDRETIQTYETISLLHGVLSAAMVYHHQESDPDAQVHLPA